MLVGNGSVMDWWMVMVGGDGLVGSDGLVMVVDGLMMDGDGLVMGWRWWQWMVMGWRW